MPVVGAAFRPLRPPARPGTLESAARLNTRMVSVLNSVFLAFVVTTFLLLVHLAFCVDLSLSMNPSLARFLVLALVVLCLLTALRLSLWIAKKSMLVSPRICLALVRATLRLCCQCPPLSGVVA